MHKLLSILTCSMLAITSSSISAETQNPITRSTSYIDSVSIHDVDKPLRIEFFNSGGYSGWFRVTFFDTAKGENVIYTSGNVALGQYVTFEVPSTAVMPEILVEGFSNTGILWDKYRTAFSFYIGESNAIYKFGSRYYFGMQSYGSTFYPSGGEYRPSMGVGVNGSLDQFSENAMDCVEMIYQSDNYGSSVAPAKQYDLKNHCQYPVNFNLYGNIDDKTVKVESNSTEYVIVPIGTTYNRYFSSRVH